MRSSQIVLSNLPMDVVYMTENELLLVKGDFLPPDKRTESWLADEESYNDEPPLYFFESSHWESPLYALWRTLAFYSCFFPNPSFSFRLLLICLPIFINKLCARFELGYANARTMKLIADSIAEICWQRAGAKKTPENRCVLLEDVQGFVWKDFPF